jgi:hypothetical protein
MSVNIKIPSGKKTFPQQPLALQGQVRGFAPEGIAAPVK